MNEKALNPQPGERYEAHDGSTIHVIGVDAIFSFVMIEDRARAGSEDFPRWVTLATFEKLAKEKL